MFVRVLMRYGYRHITGKIYFLGHNLEEKQTGKANSLKYWKYLFFSGIIWNIYVVSLLKEVIREVCDGYKIPS